jgi:hypothetical protein
MPHLSHFCWQSLAGLLVLVAPPCVLAQRGPAIPPPANPASSERPAAPVPPEKSSVTSHELPPLLRRDRLAL